ncbi:hypothetical protein AB5J62_24680 [Amycolatopsis sp. cg5]|uniref:terpene synthase family protein n=1 Tax=Amycolatopsis sp. cg5 TaxID=3238802 RepID=UPI003524C0F0
MDSTLQTRETLRLDPPHGHPILKLPSQISPHVGVLERYILEWGERFDLLDNDQSRTRLARTHLGDLMARSYPDIPEESLEAAAGWFTWAFVIDDCYDKPAWEYDESATRMLGLLNVDGPPSKASTRLDALLAELWKQMSAGQSTHWKMRFIQHTIHFLSCFKYEAINRQSGHTPNLLGYAQLRPSSSGTLLAIDLLELGRGREVLPLLHESTPLRTMRDRAVDVVCWVNDVFSLSKELAVGETTNGVLVLARERDMGLQDAIDAVYVDVARWVNEFTDARAELKDLLATWRGISGAEKNAISLYANGLRAWMRGNLDWSYGSDRYMVPDQIRLTNDISLVTGS